VTPQRQNNFTVTLNADVAVDIDRDNNQIISPSDVVYVVNRIGTNDLTADVDEDGSVTAADVSAVVSRLGDSFP